MDAFSELRTIPLLTVMASLGIDVSEAKKTGKDWHMKCPFHQPKQNDTAFSFTVELWNCFSCGSKGRGAIDFVKAYRKVGFQAATAFLETIKGKNINPTMHEGEACSVEGQLKPFKGTYQKFKVPSPWLEERIPDQEVRERYGVFCYDNPKRKSAYSGRVMIPIKDINGNLFGYVGRHIGHNAQVESDVPKYLFPKNLPKSKFLFGAYELLLGQAPAHQHEGHDTCDKVPLRYVYLVESPFCVLKFAMYGLPAVSPFGWSLSNEQVQLLSKLAKGILYLPDRNKSSEGANVVQTLAAQNWVRCPPLPVGCDDPEHLSKEEVLALT